MGDGRFALICKTHHALVDGISGVDILSVLFNLGKRRQRHPPGLAWSPQPLPSGAELLADGVIERAVAPLKWMRGLLGRARPRGRGGGTLGGRSGRDARRGRGGSVADAAERADRPAPPLRWMSMTWPT